MKRFCVVTIIFALIVSVFIIPSFAYSTTTFEPIKYYSGSTANLSPSVSETEYSFGYFYRRSGNTYRYLQAVVNNEVRTVYGFCVGKIIYFASDSQGANVLYSSTITNNPSNNSLGTYNSTYQLYYTYQDYSATLEYSTQLVTPLLPTYNSLSDGLSTLRNFIDNPPPQYNKNPNVDEFIANTLISMGVKFNSYTSALPVAQSAWNYLIDENNWYIGSGDRTDKDIKWNIDSAVSYLNAQSNNYMDWYNGYKVSKDVTIALNKFIKDNYVATTLNNGTIAGENVYLNTQYMYASSGGSAPGSSFGSSPSAFSFYPASTVTYFNGQYLHDNNEIDLDEFIYTPADVRKFISYPSSEGIIVPPEDSSGTGVVTDGNGDTVYNIDLDFPSLDWLADAIQAVLDFLNRLITTIADFLTQILDAILSLFSDAFESLTTFGQGIIEWLYSVIESLGTLGSNYIPSDLWAIILPFIYLNVGIAILMFVLRSH